MRIWRALIVCTCVVATATIAAGLVEKINSKEGPGSVGVCSRQNIAAGRVTDVRDFNIPAMSLEEGLVCASHQSGVEYAFLGVHHYNIPALQGRMRALDTFKKLVATTDLRVMQPERPDEDQVVLLTIPRMTCGAGTIPTADASGSHCARSLTKRPKTLGGDGDFNIPAGQLGDTMKYFSDQSDVAVFWGDVEGAANEPTRSVYGRHRVVDAMADMLDRSKLEVAMPWSEGDKVVRLVAKPKSTKASAIP